MRARADRSRELQRDGPEAMTTDFERWITATDTQRAWAHQMGDPDGRPLFIFGGRKQVLLLWREYQQAGQP